MSGTINQDEPPAPAAVDEPIADDAMHGSSAISSAATATFHVPTHAVTDERLARMSLWKRFMIRPEFGALAGALVVWLLFAWQAGDVWLSWQGTATYLDTAAFDIASESAALTKLPASTTAAKVCISTNLSIVSNKGTVDLRIRGLSQRSG